MGCLCRLSRTLIILRKKMFSRFIGVDVSKTKVDVFLSETGEVLQVGNSRENIERFVQKIDCRSNTLAVIDLTGGYEAVCVDVFYRAGFAVHRAEGRKVKAFMRAVGQLAKTDSIDARALADYGQRLQDKLTLFQPVENEIKPYVVRLTELKQILKSEKNRLNAPSTAPRIRLEISKHTEFLQAEIDELSKELQAVVKQNPVLLKKRQALTSQIGIGETSANVLLACLPELGTLSRRKIAALAGLAPYAQDSGTIQKVRHVVGGRCDVKRTLFICSLVAIQKDPIMRAFYEKLIQKGKKKMVAIVAVMRKMIIILNAKCKNID